MSVDTPKSPYDVAESGDGRLIDLHHVFGVIRRRRWWILATILLILLLTALAYALSTPRYTATASLALDRRVDEIVKGNATEGQLPTDSPTVDTAVEVLTSSALAGRVVDALHLERRVGFGRKDAVTTTDAQSARRRAIGALLGGLEVKRTGLSYAIDVAYTSPDPDRSAEIVNAVVDQYIEDERTGKVGERERDRALLFDRLQKLRSDVIRSEAAVAQYRAQTNLIDIQKDGTAVQQEISVLNTQLAGAQAEEAAAAARLASARGSNAGGTDNLSPVIRQLRSQEAQLSSERADLSGRYGPLHPDLAKVDRQLRDVRRSISEETGRTTASLLADARVASGRAAAIQSSLGRARGGLVAGNRASVQLNELERNSESARGLYQAFLDRYRQNVAGEGTDKSMAYVIAHALVPGAPVFPNRNVFMLGGLIAALLAAAAVVLLLELLEGGFQNRRQLEEQLQIPVIGTVPSLKTIPGVKVTRSDAMAPADYLIDNPGSLFSEAFRTIRAALSIGRPDQLVRSLAVASALPGEGKTTVSICLARSAALAGAKVVLVDCDVRRRTFSRAMAGTVNAGLSEVLAGTCLLDKALTRDEASGAWILPQSTERSPNYDPITSQAMADLIKTLSGRFDLVVLDCAPVLPLAEARAIAGMADGVLFVARWRRTPSSASKLAVDLLGRADAKIVGGVLSLVNVKHQMQSGYGDEMTYYKRFKNYYVEPAE